MRAGLRILESRAASARLGFNGRRDIGCGKRACLGASAATAGNRCLLAASIFEIKDSALAWRSNAMFGARCMRSRARVLMAGVTLMRGACHAGTKQWTSDTRFS